MTNYTPEWKGGKLEAVVIIVNLAAIVVSVLLFKATAFAQINLYEVSGYGEVVGFVEYNDKTGEIKGLIKKKSGKTVSVVGEWCGLGLMTLCGENGETFKVGVE